jgi:hypothetical protein
VGKIRLVAQKVHEFLRLRWRLLQDHDELRGFGHIREGLKSNEASIAVCIDFSAHDVDVISTPILGYLRHHVSKFHNLGGRQRAKQRGFGTNDSRRKKRVALRVGHGRYEERDTDENGKAKHGKAPNASLTMKEDGPLLKTALPVVAPRARREAVWRRRICKVWGLWE